MDYDRFLQNVINDDRSYSHETFQGAVKILNSVKKNIPIEAEPKERFE